MRTCAGLDLEEVRVERYWVLGQSGRNVQKRDR